MENEDLLLYNLQCIYNRICIAVAIGVGISKPSSLTVEEYAEEIQEIFLKNWIRRKENSIFSDKILAFQKRSVFNQLNELLLAPADSEDSHKGHGLLVDPGLNNGNLALNSNISFVEAMVQLKFAVESSKAVPIDQVHTFFDDGSPSFLREEIGREIVLRKCSEDSGFSDSGPLLDHGGSSPTVPSSILRYVTHSVKTDALLERCISSVLSTCRGLVLTEPRQRYSRWRGSILEHLASVLKKIRGSPICTCAFSAFLVSLLEEIWENLRSDKLSNLEFQLGILKKFCYNDYISEAVIDVIMQKIDILACKLSTLDLSSESDLSYLHMIEEAPLFLEMAQDLLKSWLGRLESRSGDMETISSSNTLTDLWKKEPVGGPKSDAPDANKAEKWLKTCEKLLVSSAPLLPMLSTQVWELKSTLSSFKSFDIPYSCVYYRPLVRR